jgi:hypothetical protein
MTTRYMNGTSYTLSYDTENRLTSVSGGALWGLFTDSGADARYCGAGSGTDVGFRAPCHP